MSKNIVVLSDGTGQEGGRGHDSNVYKLYRMLEDRTQDQIIFYDQGLGTDWRKVTGNAFGVGFTANIEQCYRFIFENYNAGDKIFLFGFSRGAATVRSLSSFIHYFGVLPRARSRLIDEAFALYETGRPPATQDSASFIEDNLRKDTGRGTQIFQETSYQIYKAFRKDLSARANQFTLAHPNMWVEIEFLGVWDTVPALGFVPQAGVSLVIDRIPWWRHNFHDFALHRSVKNAYQALSIDDDREWFVPTIWNQYGDENKQKIKQVWFTGSHTDVGGGYREAGLSDITLEWMVKNAVAHGIRLYTKSRRYWNFCIAPDETDVFHPPRAGFGRVFKSGSRSKVWDQKAIETFGPPIVHKSVLERARQNPNYRPWILKSYGNYPDPEKWLKENLEKYLRAKYLIDLEKRYQEWCLARWERGDQNLPDVDAWLRKHPFSFSTWLRSNRAEVKKWQDKNDYAVEEFEGQKFMVEREEITDLRDYDRTNVAEKLEQTLSDQRAGDNLWLRGMGDDRLEYDQKRWSEADDKLKKKTA